MSEQRKEGEWHRVMLNTIVRKGVALDSERLRILPMGSRVFVTSRLERRVEITEPIHGWCSLKSSNGDTILTPVQDGTPSGKGVPATPSANSNVAAKFNTFQARAQAAQVNVEKTEANIDKWSSNLSEESRKRIQDLARISEKKALEEKLLQLSQDLKGNENPEHQETVQELTNALRERQDATNKKRIFEQMGEAASNEISNIKKQYSDYFGVDMENHEKGEQLYPRDVIQFIHPQDGKGLAIVRYFGPVEGEPAEVPFVGLELSGPSGNTNGEFRGRQYFETKDDHALFLKHNDPAIVMRIEAGDLLQKLNSVLLRISQHQSSRE